MDYFWLLAAVWAGFGALLTALVLRRLDISRMSYHEARQLLSSMVASLSARIHQNEILTKELSEQLQILSTNQARLTAQGQTADKERLLEYMQDSMTNVRRFIEKVDVLQKNLKSVETEFREMRKHVDEVTSVQHVDFANQPTPVGVVTKDTITALSDTERGVLELLVTGPKAAPEIGRLMTKSREHTARLMKSLHEQGFVERETHRQPYEYRLNDKVREAIGHSIRDKQTTGREDWGKPRQESSANDPRNLNDA